MKKIVQILSLLIITILFHSIAVVAESEVSYSDKHFVGWEKLNLSLRHYLENLEREKIELTVQTNKAIDDADKKSLLSAGFQFRSVIPSGKNKTILTGSILPSHVEKLAALPFVKSIESSIHLQYQKKAILKKN